MTCYNSWRYGFCEINRVSLQYVYMPLLRQELTGFVEEHNAHRIRKQHGKKTPQGIPEDLYSFPELKGMPAVSLSFGQCLENSSI